MLVDIRKPIDRVAMRAGWKLGEIRCRIFRHTYTAARLQTLDHSAPISLYTVSRELGHGSEDMVRRVYSHLDSFRHRSEVIEYRVERHFERLGGELVRLGFDTKIGTNPQAGTEKRSPRSHRSASGEDVPEWARHDSNARPLASKPPDPGADQREQASFSRKACSPRQSAPASVGSSVTVNVTAGPERLQPQPLRTCRSGVVSFRP
jgi:hypothetical protein